MLLRRIIAGSEPYSLLIIEDCLQQRGTGLLHAIVKHLSAEVDLLNISLYECSSSQFTEGLESTVVNKLSISDLSCDLYGWLSGSAMTSDSLPREQRVESKSAFMFDSISHLVSSSSVSSVCQMLNRLRWTKSTNDSALPRIVAVIHSDLHDTSTLKAVEQTADCVLKLTASQETVDINGISSSGFCDVVLKRPSGRVVVGRELFSVTDSYDVVAAEMKPASVASALKPTPDPTANLTFNLKINPKELEARSNVVLPFTAAAATQHVTTELEELSSEFDEEDPDDDLDI